VEETDKFEETGLTPKPSKKVKAPIIEECVVHLEYKLHDQFKTGDHSVFVGETVQAYVNKGVFRNKYNIEKVRMIFHLGGSDFATSEQSLHTESLTALIAKVDSFRLVLAL
jgi:flavin reductase (DIM6/NTAB) family NADH-FMN oxidoreductase RutF